MVHLADSQARGWGPGPLDENTISFGVLQDENYGPGDINPAPRRYMPVPWPSLSGPGEKPIRHPLWFACGINYFEPTLPLYSRGICQAAVQRAFRDVEGRDLEQITHRYPEIICEVMKEKTPIPGAYVYLVPLQGQPLNPRGVKADKKGRAWFTIPHSGKYSLECALPDGSTASKTIKVKSPVPITPEPGFGHILTEALDTWK